MFDNHLEKLIENLEVIQRIIRTFSEISIGSAQKVEVHQISTSNPWFFFGLDVKTTVMIGGVVTWSLNTWTQVEEIKTAREASSAVFSEDDLKEIFDKKAKVVIEARIKAKAGRTKEELSGHVTYAVDAILRLVEQGVKVEIRLVPPPPEKDTEERPEFEQLRKIVPQLVFPEVEGPPILGLPAPPKDRG